MKHIAIIDEHNSAEELGNMIKSRFSFSVSDCVSGFNSEYTGQKPDAIILNADFSTDKTKSFVNSLRNVDFLKSTPILLVTSDNDCEHQADLLSCGADDIMHFPLCKELIIKRLNLHIRENEAFHPNCDGCFCFDDIMDMVTEKKYERGGYSVEKNDFANICRFVVRGLERSRKNVQVLLMTLNNSTDRSENEVAENVMQLLSNAVKLCLRRGDISSVCSKNQIVILLMDADDDGGHLVANRIVSNFYGECDDDNFELHYDIREIDRAV